MSASLGQTLEEWAELRGVERGRLENSRHVLCRLLEKKFGPLGDELHRRIDAAQDLDRLEEAIVACPDLRSVDELQL